MNHTEFVFLGDFHLHSRYSDGVFTIPQLVDLFGSSGFGAIAITDHLCEERTFIGKTARYLGRTLTEKTFPRYLETLQEEAERAWKRYRMLLISGVEFTKNAVKEEDSAHVLALGLNSFIRPDLDIAALVKAIHEQGALAIAAHPVHTRKKERQTHQLWKNRWDYSCMFDAWEVASGPHWFDEVAATRLPKIASSDMHGPSQMKSWKTLLRCERHPKAVLEAIRRQEIGFHFFDPPSSLFGEPLSQGAPRRLADRVFDWSLTMF